MHPLTVEQQRRKDAPQKARRYRRQSPLRNPMLPRLRLIDHPNRPDSAPRVHRRPRTPSPNSEAITDNLTSTQRRTVHGLHDGCVQELGRSGSCSPPLAFPSHPIQTSDEQAGSSDTTHGGGDGKRRCRSFHRLGVAGLAIRMALGHELTRRSERSASLEAANTDGSSTS